MDIEIESQKKNENIGISIQLGDIIQLISPSEYKIHDKIFFVYYIDNHKIKLLSDDGSFEYTINLNEDGTLTNESITSIAILSRADVFGYARQNSLLPDKWINIYFNGDIPVTITGKITNIEEDMIEIKTYPDNDIIYIDFEYKGLPETLPIEKIVIRNPPSELKSQKILEKETEIVSGYDDEIVSQDIETNVTEISQEELNTQPIIEPTQVKNKLKEIFLDADQIFLGEELQEIVQVITVSESEQRYSIDKQTNDLLDDLLSSVPNAQRTDSVLKNIHRMIERFKQLRNEYSKFDKYGNANLPDKKGPKYKPLVHSLSKLNKKLYWILPVCKTKKKIYDIEYIPNDIELINNTLEEDTIEVNNLINLYKNNSVPDENNSYNYLISKLNYYFTPFDNPGQLSYNLETMNVNDNINAIIDNLSDLASIVVKNENLVKKKYVIQTYNLGLTKLQPKENQQKKVFFKREKLTPDDIITIKSFITLPEPVLRYSHINLPGTNILDKSNLNLNNINYWQLLNKKSNIYTEIIDKFDISTEKIFETERRYLSGIKEYILDETINDDDKYIKFLDRIIPMTRILFDLISRHVYGKLSLYNIVKFLEPFLIYQKDLSFFQYRTIINFLETEIIDKNKEFVSKATEFKKLQNVYEKSSIIRKSFKDTLFYLFKNIYLKNDNINLLDVFNYYNIDYLDRNSLTNIEIFDIINNHDYGEVYSLICTYNNLNLIIPQLMNDITNNIEKNNIDYKTNIEPNNKSCPRYILSKKYKTLQELEKDNNIEIYFDNELDTTRYDIIKEYSHERKNMDNDQFLEFLKNKLITSIGLTEIDAQRDAVAMIKGKREVLNGDYALLQTINYETGENTNIYFKRDGGIWNIDNNITSYAFGDDNKTLCNSDQECLNINNKCNDIDTNEYIINNQNVDKILKEFEDKYFLEKEQLITNLQNKFKYNMLNRVNINNYHFNKIIKNNNTQFKLGELFDIDSIQTIQSPFSKIRDIILNQDDMTKKQNDIIMFVKNFTREPIEHKEEDINWLYCIDTNIKLLPNFLYELAIAFNNGKYTETLEKVCAKQGTISDDGNTWVDKHSGYVIRYIEFNDEEGYDERGFKILTHDLLGEEIELRNVKSAKSTEESEKEMKKYKSIEAEIISNIIYAMTSFMSINIENVYDFIVKKSLETFSKTMPSKETYEKTLKNAEEKGKKFPSYQERYDTTILLVTLSYLLVGILISKPSIKTKKTYPGCIKSFTGYPLTGIEDKTSLIYICCIANKIKSSIRPWNSILKVNQSVLIQKLEQIIEKYIITDVEVENKLIDKREYILLEGLEEIPFELDLSRYSNFLPPLRQFKIKTPSNVTEDFKKLMIDNIRSGKKEQYEQLNVLKSKVIELSLYIQILIQNVISKEIPILKTVTNEPFLENSCCNQDGINTYNYFTKRENDIIKYSKIINELSNINEDMNDIAKSSILIDPNDTRKNILSFTNEFNEKTIYQAFIIHCKFNSDLPISDDLQKICLEKPQDFNVDDTIQDKISKLKRDGKNYSHESLEYLMDIIYSNNIINNIVNIHEPELSYTQVLREITGHYIEYDKATQFEISLNKILDTYDIALDEDTEEMRNFKNYLSKSNNSMIEEITSYIKLNHKIKRTEYDLLVNSFNNLMSFNLIDSELFYNENDASTYKSIQFIKNSLRDLIYVYPNIILNNVNYKNIKIPNHWKLSKLHETNIQALIGKYYSKFEIHYKNKDTIKYILQNISKELNDIYIMAMNTPFLAPILNNEKITYSIFERRMATLLFNYYILNVFKKYIKLAYDLSELSEKIKQKNERNPEEISIQEEEETEFEIVIGNKKDLYEKVAHLLYTYINVMNENKVVINYNHDQIMEKVLRIREKEKQDITYDLERLTDDERNVEKVFKSHKLEKWGIGLQKGLTRYDPKLYDKEREMAEKRTLLDITLSKNIHVNMMNANIFALDLENKMVIESNIEREAYDMSGLPEDDDYGDNDDIDDYRNDLYQDD
jgi:hypothetical protein